ncbi:Fc.00g070760.m01.CDS01 [Cosmosporella sp. VM-42]
MASSSDSALVVLFYIYPAVIFLYYIVASLVSVCSIHAVKKTAGPETKRPSPRIVLCLFAVFLITFVAQLAATGTRSILSRELPIEDHIVIGRLSCILVFGIQIGQLFDADYMTAYPFVGSWALSFLFEVTIATISAGTNLPQQFDTYEIIDISMISLRCLILLVLAGLFIPSFSTTDKTATDEERQSLLPKAATTPGSSAGQSQNSEGTGYGSTLQAEESTTETTEETTEETPEYNWERREREAKEAMKKRLEEGGNWLEYAKGFKILFPYVWPIGNIGLQLRAAAVCLCLFGSNALHLLIPRQTGIIMDSLGGTNQSNPWLAVLIFATLRLAASESGIELVRQWLWIPVKYYSHDALTRAAYSHMMHLSADFHDSKSSSDMMMAIYGGSAVSNVIENVLLYAVPMLIDMGVAVVYLSITFGPYEGLITVATGIFFLLIASRLVANSKSASRNRVNALYEEHYVRQSGFLGWQTVSAFNQIGYEDNRHANAVTNRWLREQQYAMGWYISIGFQTLVLTSGLLASAFLAVYRIRAGHATAGQFAMLLMYWAQLTSPLQFFAKLGKNISDDFIDAERLLDIMRTKPSVENQKGARPLKFVAGEVEFDEVCFSYDKQKGIIKDVSFQVPAGQTVAFVGATGAGKSTLLKLLDRFYDVTKGSIRIDGQDLRDVDLFSLRDRIGVVPQNPILFDDTIISNVRYGRITASDEEVYEACEAACIHDKIKGFTHGYKTRVGERGVKLSGGELQRIAIARAILKKPDIVLLDEATSAVDTDTEQQIQVSFRRLCQGRTTFIVAHRLSTIMNADRIIVVENGQITEQGSHNELIVAGGRYADLWSKQVFVRPSDEGKAKDDSATQAGIVNDLSTEQTQTELSKVKPVSTATKDEKTKGGSTEEATPKDVTTQDVTTEDVTTEDVTTQLDTSNDEAAKDSEGQGAQQNGHEDGVASTPKHLNEGYRLNPVAATFTPRSLGAPRQRPAINTSTDSDDSISKDTTKVTTPQTSRQWSDEVAAQDQEEAVSQPAVNGKAEEELSQRQEDGERSKTKKVDPQKAFTEASSEAMEAPKTVSILEPLELKYPRYSRRVQSKSEPSSHASQDPDAVDDELRRPLPDVLEESESLVHRRVSAPPLKGIATSFTTQIPKASVSSTPTQTTYPRKNTDKQNTAPGTESEHPSQETESTLANQRRANRGGKRGRGPWYRGRRGRGGIRGGSKSPNNLT